MTDAAAPQTIDAERETFVRNAGDCALIAAGLFAVLAIVVALLQPPWMHRTIWLPLVFVLTASLPFVIVGRRLQQGLSARALGAASALAYITVVTIFVVTVLRPTIHRMWAPGMRNFVLWQFVGYLMIAGELLDYAMSTPGYVVLILVTGTCLFLAVHARRARVAYALSDNFDYLKGWSLACGYSVLALPIFFALARAQSTNAYEQNVERSRIYNQVIVYVRKTLRRVQTCLYDYAATHPAQGFPKDLKTAADNGTVCFDPELADELFANASLRYAADTPDSAGRVTAFWLVAEPTSDKAVWRKQYYADERGLVYYADMKGRDDSIMYHGKIPDSPLPPPRELLSVIDSPALPLSRLQLCLASRDAPYWPYFPMALDANHRCVRGQQFTVSDNALTVPVRSPFQSDLIAGNYVLIYRPRRPETEFTAAGYEIELRPMEYGVDGTRSYWTSELGRIHWTRDDRSATPNDPPIDACEIDPSC